MLTIRKSDDRGQANHGWLDTRYSFSFSEYHDPAHMGFRALRVINDDKVAPGGGFAPHPHRDMEIITYITKGAIAHKDSMGNTTTIPKGDIQVMTAGAGVVHSEFNPSATEPLELLQIWIIPDKRGLKPSYGQMQVDFRPNALTLLASPDAAGGSLKINQDVRLYAAKLDKGASLLHALKDGRHAWLQLVSGALQLNGTALAKGDGIQVSDVPELTLEASEAAEFLLFDLN